MKLIDFSKDKKFKFIDWERISNSICFAISLILLIIQIYKELSGYVFSGMFDNISYSFIAGYIFYLLINYIPSRIRGKKASVILYPHFDSIWTMINATEKFSVKLGICYSDIKNNNNENNENYKVAYDCLARINSLYKVVLNRINEVEKLMNFMSLQQVEKLQAIKNHYVFIVCDIAIKGGNINLFEEISINYKNLIDIAANLRNSVS